MLKVSLVTPDKKVLTDAEVEEIFVPAFRGELNILPGHAPLVSTLSTGVLKYRLKGETSLQSVVVSWGYLEVANDIVTVLAETAEEPGELDLNRALAAKKAAELELGKQDLEAHQFGKYQLKLERALIRIGVVDSSGDTSKPTSH